MNVIESEDQSKSRIDLAINTSELDPQVLKQLVDNNPDLASQKLDIIEQEPEEIKDDIKDEVNELNQVNEVKEVNEINKIELNEVLTKIDIAPNAPLQQEKLNSKASLTLITEPKVKVNQNLIKMISELEEKRVTY
jgi:hypothetical protein